MSQEAYRIMQTNKQLHWYCKGCSRGAVTIMQALTKVQERQVKMQGEISRVSDDMTKMRNELKDIETKFENKMLESEIKMQNEIKKLASDVVFESFIEEKMLASAKQFENRQREDLEKMKLQMNDSDKKLDSVIEVKLTESREEEKQRAERRNNVIIFGVEESTDEDVVKRVEHDREIIKEISETLLLDSTKARKLTRLGKKATDDENGDRKSRPLKVVFDDESSKTSC